MPKLAGYLSQLTVRSRTGEAVVNVTGAQITEDLQIRTDNWSRVEKRRRNGYGSAQKWEYAYDAILSKNELASTPGHPTRTCWDQWKNMFTKSPES